MQRAHPPIAWWGPLIAFLLLALAVGQNVRMERAHKLSQDSSKALIYLPSAAQARIMSLGFTTVMADYYWVKALQYFTDPQQAANHYKNLSDFLELVIALDPDFEYAYVFAGVSIPFDSGRMRFVNADRSTSFLERGVKRFPANWKLRFYLGYNYLNYHDRPREAAEQFLEASRLPDSPAYLRPFAARVLTVAGDIDRAILMVEQSLEEETNPEIRGLLERRRVDLQFEVQLRKIEAAAKQFLAREGRYPRDLDELRASGLAEDIPPGYTLGPDGVAMAPEKTERMIIHVHPEEEKVRNKP